MALINCPECRKEISDEVKTCPHCGYKIKRISKKFVLFILACILIASTIGVLTFFLPRWKMTQEYNKGIDFVEVQNYQKAVGCFVNVIEKQDVDVTSEFGDINCLLAFSNAKNTYLTTENERDKLTLSREYLKKIPNDYDGVMSTEIIEFKKSLELEFQTFTEAETKRIEAEEKERARIETLREQGKNREAFYDEVKVCPLSITLSTLSFNAIDNPQVSVSVKNNSQKTVDAFTVQFYLYDNFNKPVNHYVYDHNMYKGIAQKTIKSGGSLSSSSYYWTPHGHENSTKFIAIITEIHYTDNSTWSMSDGAIKYAKIYSDSEIQYIKFE